jgi:hypothetical protein
MHNQGRIFVALALLPVILITGIGWHMDQNVLSNPRIKQVNSAINPSLHGISPTSDGVLAMIGQVNQDRILSDLKKLSGEEEICLDQGCYKISDRSTGSTGLRWAKDYVRNKLIEMGYTVVVQDWKSGKYADQNLIVRRPGIIPHTAEIYFVAHLDGANSSPAADDNASGVVDLLELARILRTKVTSNTIVFLFTTGEEQGSLGSKYYVNNLTLQQVESISYVIDVDMVGYDSNADGVMEIWNGSQPLEFADYLINIISNYQIGIIPQIASDCG